MAEAKAKVRESAAEETEEWIYTVKSKTGEVVKIERVDKETGHRKELSLPEYLAVISSSQAAGGYGGYSYDPYAAYSYGYDPYGSYSSYGYDPYGSY